MGPRFPGPRPSAPPRYRRSSNSIVVSALTICLAALVLFAGTAAAYTELSDDFLATIPPAVNSNSNSNSNSNDNNDENGGDLDAAAGRLLAPLLIPRVPGTEGQARAQEHLAGFFRDELPRWEAAWQNSTATTPATGDRQVPFANLLLRRRRRRGRNAAGGDGGPENTAYLTLAAHYDSKLAPAGFVGATDSAAPCAMLLHVARSVEGHLARLWGEDEDGDGDGDGDGDEGGQKEGQGGVGRRHGDDDDNDNDNDNDDGGSGDDVGIQILLLDGEEAFVTWTATDSLYGARALAEEWDNTANPALSTYRSPLGQISLLVLLDLLGSAEPSVPSYFQTTHWAYRAMAGVEGRMRRLGLLESAPRGPFLPQAEKRPGEFRRAGVEDDHLPFMRRGVPVLHVIPSPFPRVWHTLDDDGAHLDPATVRDWARIVTAFALEWLDAKAHPTMPATAERGGTGGG